MPTDEPGGQESNRPRLGQVSGQAQGTVIRPAETTSSGQAGNDKQEDVTDG